MKQYRKDAKQHMSNEEYDVWRKNKRRKTCKGGKEHDYVLVAPYGYSSIEHFTFLDADQIKECYESEQKGREWLKAEEERLLALGIIKRGMEWRHRVSRSYLCSVCGKRYSEFES